MIFKLITGRTLMQGSGKEIGKFSPEYQKEISTVEVDPDDLKSLSLAEGSTVTLKTQFGEATVTTKASKHAPHSGILFLPYGLTANLLTNPNTDGSGMPTLKGIDVEIMVK